MKLFLQYLLLLLPSLAMAHGNHTHAIGKVSRVRIFTTPSQISSLKANGMSIDHGVWRRDVYFECEVFEQDLALLALTTTPFEITYSDANQYYAERRALYTQARKNAQTCENNNTQDLEDKYAIPEDFELGSFSGFLTYQEMLDHLDNMSAKYPNLITQRAPISDFRTHQDREIFHLKMSDNVNTDEHLTEKQFLYTAVHHSREPVSMSQLIFTMYYFLENYEKDPIIKALLDENELFFVPCLNPDGYHIDQENAVVSGQNYEFAYWRKNARDNDNNGFITNNDGVDLNRNYSYAWGQDNQGSSGNFNSQTYRGPSAASEPEVQAIAWLCQQHEFKIALNCHTYSNILIHPWGHIPFNPTPDSTIFRTLGRALTIDNRYAVGTGDELLGYSVNGEADDWMYGDTSKNKIFAFTPEVGSAADGFYPPAERIIPLCLNTVLQNINAVRCMGNYAYPTLINQTISSTEGLLDIEIEQAGLEPQPIAATIKLQNITSNIPLDFEIDLAFSQKQSLQIPFTINPNLPQGTKVGAILVFTYPNGSFEEFEYLTEIESSVSEALLENINENGDSLSNWTNTQSWNITTQDFYSAPSCYTDSPESNYTPGLSYISFTDTIDLTQASVAELKFWARWNIEAQYDYVQVNAIDLESNSKTALCGKYTKIGDNYYLSPDEPYFDGIQQDWIEETMDLSSFIGKKINIEYELFADNYVEEDGFYFDDFRIFTDIQLPTDTTDVEEPTDTTTTDSIGTAITWAVKNVLNVSTPMPNPASLNLNISYNLPTQDGNGKLVIYNIEGKIVQTINIASGLHLQNAFDISQLNSGLYFYQIQQKNVASATQRLVVTH